MKERSFEQILEEMNDSVNKPNHYCGEYGLESIDVIRNFCRKPERSSGILLGKCYQISLSIPEEERFEDLDKAKKYLEWLIEDLKNNHEQAGIIRQE